MPEDSFLKTVSDVVRERIKEANAPFHANDNISQFLEEGELQLLQNDVETAIQHLLEVLVIDTKNDHNTNGTAERVARMYVNELYKGRYHPQPKVTEFPNAKELGELFTLGPISINSTCAHHMVPIIGQVWVGVIPGKSVLGLSKYNRVIDWIMSRPHIQEEAIIILADYLEELIEPEALAVVIKATHQCMTCRGVKEKSGASMINSVVRGLFENDAAAKSEFFSLIAAQGFGK